MTAFFAFPALVKLLLPGLIVMLLPTVYLAWPPTPGPDVTLSATIDLGATEGEATLSWKSTDATDVSLESPQNADEDVEHESSRSISTENQGVYAIRARGRHGIVRASVTIVPRPALPQLEPVSFGFGRSEIEEPVDRMNDRAKEIQNFLRLFPGSEVAIQGYCDKIGSSEFNMRLGGKRAIAVRNSLMRLMGNDESQDPKNEDRLVAMSLGNELCDREATDEGREKDRKVEFVFLPRASH